MSKEGVDYGVYYASRWNSIDRVLGDLHKTIDRREWDAFYSLPTSNPVWLQERMRNGMAVLARDGVFLADGKFSLLTSNPGYPGNLGSPEERLADACFFLQCFPELLRSELELMTGGQLTDGEVPSAVGNLYSVIGNGNIPGGLMGSPDSTAAYVMLIYHYFLWTGDREFLEDKYPHIRYALQWLSLRDRNMDAIPEGSSLWPWAGDGVTSLFTGSLALAAYRVGEELEQLFRDLEFQSWCTRKGRMIVQNMISQLWSGDYYHPFFDPKRPDSPDSQEQIAGQLPGEWYALQMGWRPFLPQNHLQRLAQVISRESAWKSNADPGLSESAWRYGFAPAFTGPLLRHYGFLDEADRIHEYDSSRIEPAWWSYANAASGLALDMNRRCLIVGPTAKADGEFQCPFFTPFYSGSIRYSRSSLAGQQECVITLDRVPDWRDAGLQQIAFALPAYTDANEMTMQVFHNGAAAAGQDFSRESMRVFGFQPELKVKKGDRLKLLVTSANGPQIVVNVNSRDIYNYGGKCSIERIGLSLPSVSFNLTNLLRQSQLISLLLTNPGSDTEYAVFINGEKRPLPIPSQEPISMMLPQSSISMNDVALLRMTVGACKDAALKLSSSTGMDGMKKELWDLQEEVN
ncbi:MAG: GH116 family glycosyl hydrolase, partial [Candidatus Hinthialibacter sp.]